MLPNSSRVGGGYTKRILREAMKGVAPQRTLTDKLKLGFHPPQTEWFNDSMRKWVLEIATDRTFVESTLFNGKKIRDNIINFNDNKLHDMKKWDSIGGFFGPVCVTWWCQNSNYN